MALLHEASEGARQAWGWPLATASRSSLQPPLRPLHTSTRDFNSAPCGESWRSSQRKNFTSLEHFCNSWEGKNINRVDIMEQSLAKEL
jgi:hypothetical protein